ncbi:hypothetical protein T07_11403 [Trichinella nelsoni]|uniref:Uncharacterized protein n=1 Tax=Trichinella nelsoni TaxID=6336 RepID=A0A0V0S2Y3_9BILA|nr:hypothetical protein T07_11403 [Trichinella nelsoni]
MDFFVEAFTTILSAKKLENDDVLMISLSLFGQMAQADLSKFYFELCRDPEVITLNKQQIEELKNDYMPPKLDEMSRLLNGTFCMLTIGKKIDVQFCVEWMTARAKAIYSILDVPWSDKALDKVIIPERLKVLSDAFGRAQRMRCTICMFIIHMSNSMVCEQPIYKYIADMLQYSQLVGFYLIYDILVCDTLHPIMKDSYLTMDTMRFVKAYDVWNQYPKCYRKYMGLMADKDTLSLMGGNCLRRLTYIAIQIAARRDPSIKNLKFVLPPDSDKLDLLIKKYFPDVTTSLNTINLAKMITPLVASTNAKRYLDEVVNTANSSLIRTALEDAFGKEKEDQRYMRSDKEPINIQIFLQSDDDRFNALMNSALAGDTKPSQLLREMRRKCGKDLDPNTCFFKKLFLQRLPLNIQMILRANTYSNIEEMANKADELIALSNNSSGSICTVKKVNGDKAPTLEERIEDLEERFRSLNRRPDDAPRIPSPKRRSSSRAGRHIDHLITCMRYCIACRCMKFCVRVFQNKN